MVERNRKDELLRWEDEKEDVTVTDTKRIIEGRGHESSHRLDGREGKGINISLSVIDLCLSKTWMEKYTDEDEERERSTYYVAIFLSL